jgi:hypothetical protein
MSDFLVYNKTAQQIETEINDTQIPKISFNAWTAQNIVFELIRNYFLANTPASLGFPIQHKFDLDPLKSEIFLEISYNYSAVTASKRPAIFIGRDDLRIAHPTFGQRLGPGNYIDSESSRITINVVPVKITVVGHPVMLTELLAEYVKQPLLYFQQEILNDFGLRRFRLVTVSKPEVMTEQKDNFKITLVVEIAFDEGWIIKRDDLKLKTVSRDIFDKLTGLQFTAQ